MEIDKFALKYLKLHLRKAVPSQYGRIDRRNEYQAKLLQFDIQPGERVLDIGSGHDPFPQATHLADYYEGDTTHRAHAPIQKDGRPFAVCSVEDTPYDDHYFNFVYCSHVLEHVDHPGKACRELMRISKRGYIETPTKMTDIMLNHMHLKNHHRWHVNVVGNSLVFIEYMDAEKDYDTKFDHFYHAIHSPYQNTFQDMYYKNFRLFYNMFFWKDHFSFFVFDKQGNLIDQSHLS